jgi:hypothetical protein
MTSTSDDNTWWNNKEQNSYSIRQLQIVSKDKAKFENDSKWKEKNMLTYWRNTAKSRRLLVSGGLEKPGKLWE